MLRKTTLQIGLSNMHSNLHVYNVHNKREVHVVDQPTPEI